MNGHDAANSDTPMPSSAATTTTTTTTTTTKVQPVMFDYNSRSSFQRKLNMVLLSSFIAFARPSVVREGRFDPL